MSLIISWGKELFTVQFLEEFQQFDSRWTQQVTLKRLIEKCSLKTGIPVENIKLLYSGDTDNESSLMNSLYSFWNTLSGSQEDKKGSFVLMRDPSATLSKYRIKADTKIMMLGNKTIRKPPSSAAQSSPSSSQENLNIPSSQQLSRTEALLVQRLESIHADAKDVLFPLIKKYKEDIDEYFNGNPSHFTEKYMKDSNSRVSELLMQTLLKVDGVQCEAELMSARQKRKELVKLFQGYLDQIDVLREQVNKKK